MTGKEAAAQACENARKEKMSKAASVFMDEFSLAEGRPDAEALWASCGERFQRSLRVYDAAFEAALKLAAAVLP